MSEFVPEPIVGEHAVLRPVTPADLIWLHKAAAETSVAAWWNTGEGTKWVDELLDEKDVYGYIIEVNKTPVGFVEWYEETDPEYRSAGVDIFLITDAQDKGLGSEVVRTLAKWLFEKRGHHRLTIDPAAENERAIKSYKKVGFKPIGVARKRERKSPGHWRDSLLMDMLPEDLTRE